MTMTVTRPSAPGPANSIALPMTRSSRDTLERELRRLLGPSEGTADKLSQQDRAARVAQLQKILAVSVVEPGDDDGRAIVGRRVHIAEEDGSQATYSLVIPGDGQPVRGRLGVDAPLG